jgi:hypothetical protein
METQLPGLQLTSRCLLVLAVHLHALYFAKVQSTVTSSATRAHSAPTPGGIADCHFRYQPLILIRQPHTLVKTK